MRSYREMKKLREPWLDHLRGATLVSMILYHGCWDMVYLLGFPWDWYKGTGAWLWQQSICWTFILLSGYCWSMGRHHWKRGLTTFAAGALVWLVTAWLMPDSAIRFGVLTFLGSAALLMIPMDRAFQSIFKSDSEQGKQRTRSARSSRAAKAGLIVSALLFLVFRNTAKGWLGIGLGGKLPGILGGIPLLALPSWLYELGGEGGWLSAWLGFQPEGFSSTDYFPLLPWWFLFCAGYFLRKWKEAQAATQPEAASVQTMSRRTGFVERHRSNPVFRALDWMGRHSLLVYLIHQPLLYLLVILYAFTAVKL